MMEWIFESVPDCDGGQLMRITLTNDGWRVQTAWLPVAVDTMAAHLAHMKVRALGGYPSRQHRRNDDIETRHEQENDHQPRKV
jgi:hypothetical protein